MRYALLLTLVVAALALLLSSAGTCQAGILLPQQVTFDANDLDRSLSDASGASSSSQNSPQWPSHDRDDESDPLSLLKTSLPAGQSSSNTSSSPIGSASSTLAVCATAATLALHDDISLGRLAEDRGLSLPDPPGTDLLRPPRSRG